MKVKVIGQWSSEMTGNVIDGDILDLDPFLAEQFIQRGYVAQAGDYETKIIRQTPVVGDVPLASGPDSDASLSQAAPASRKKIATSSKAKK
jgi:hypothetical protein